MTEAEKAAPGWYEQDDHLRYWDGASWGAVAPPVKDSLNATAVVWALALAFGIAGAAGWEAPTIAFYWPLGLGAAGVALSLLARSMEGETPWWAIIAVIASVAALIIGIEGLNQINDLREGLE